MTAERRDAERFPIKLSASCRVPATPHRVTVLDVSHNGCRVTFDQADIPTGSTVHLDLQPASSVTGQVVWVNARAAGIRFHRRLRSEIAVDLGIEQPTVVEPEPEIVYEQPKGLHHWVRRIFGFGPN